MDKERRQLRIETKSGIKDIEIFVKDGKMEKATVDMGEVKLDGELPEDIEVRGMALRFVGIDVGIPMRFISWRTILSCPSHPFRT